MGKGMVKPLERERLDGFLEEIEARVEYMQRHCKRKELERIAHAAPLHQV